MKILKYLFSFEGRIGRLSYFLHMILAPMILLSVIFSVFGLATKRFEEAIFGIIIGVFAVSISGMSAATRRCHDLNRSGWYQLWGFVPIYNLVIMIRLFFERGTIGDNRFGTDPLMEAEEKAVAKESVNAKFSGMQKKDDRFNRG